MGELCFAMLGRTVLGDNHQCKLTKLQQTFQAQPYIQAVAAGTQQHAGLELAQSGHVSNSSYPAELAKLKCYLKITIQGLQEGTWCPLSSSACKRKTLNAGDCPYAGPIPLPASLFFRLQPHTFSEKVIIVSATLQRLLEEAED
jgi:hypothetical protein